MPTFIRWPLRHFPVCLRGGSFPMEVPHCNRAYAHATLALHLHEYTGRIRMGRRDYELEPGDVTISPGGPVLTRYELAASGRHLCLHVAPVRPPSVARSIRLPVHLRLGPAVPEARERFWRVIDHLRRAGDRPDSAAAWAASAALQELFLWLHLQGERSAGPRRDSLVEEAMQKLGRRIEASFTQPMLLGELAAGVGLSSAYVARLFAQRHGMRLQRYLLLRRIELARHLLVSSDLPVAQIGRQVGLPDPQYFNKQFRRIAGVSPLAYRRLHGAAAGRSFGHKGA